MEYDHTPGHTKRARVAALVKYESLSAILAELDKCELVCANCHRVRTWSRDIMARLQDKGII